MWHTLGARSSSAHVLQLVCAMTVSSGAAMCFLNNRQDGVIQSRLGKTFLFFDERNSNTTTTMCEEAPARRKEVESYHRMPLPARGESDGHAIFGLLLGKNMIESYEVFRRPEEDSDNNANVIVAHVKLGDRIDGHPGVVHGGILSLIFDEALGFGYEAIGVKMAVTANLNVDFRAPVLAGTYVRVAAQLEQQEGRKLFWKAQMTSMDEKTVFAEASSLYIIPRSAAA